MIPAKVAQTVGEQASLQEWAALVTVKPPAKGREAKKKELLGILMRVYAETG